eukprot:7267512-Prymnesium_polylepis.1
MMNTINTPVPCDAEDSASVQDPLVSFDGLKKKKKKKQPTELQDAEAEEVQSGPFPPPSFTSPPFTPPRLLAMSAPLREQPLTDKEERAERLLHNYRLLHGRIQDLLHPDGEATEKEKLKLPPPEVTKPNSKTSCVVNFAAFCAAIGRPPEHVAAFVQTEMGTTSSLDAQHSLRVAYANAKKVTQVLRRYVL